MYRILSTSSKSKKLIVETYERLQATKDLKDKQKGDAIQKAYEKLVKDSNTIQEVESKADYSIHLEFGTQNMKARPFMFPALEENKPKIRRMFANIKGKPK